jgi:hypothetical protein
MRAEHLQYATGFVGQMDQLVERLESEGRWRVVTRQLIPNFVLGKDGLLIVFQVLA